MDNGQHYRQQTEQFEKWFGNLPGAMFPLALLVTAWLCLQPVVAIALAGEWLIADPGLAVIWHVIMSGLAGTAALVFGAAQMAQAIFRTVGRWRAVFGILFLLLQFGMAIVQTLLAGRDFAGGYLAETLVTNFILLTLIVGWSFVPVVFVHRRFWFLPVYAVVYLFPSVLLVRGEILLLGNDPGAVGAWLAGCLVQALLYHGAVGRAALRGFAARFLPPRT